MLTPEDSPRDTARNWTGDEPMELFKHSSRSTEELLATDHYTPEELAALLSMGVNVIRDACYEGDLKCNIVNHDIVSITRADVLKWLETR
jgi:hypothetical protein